MRVRYLTYMLLITGLMLTSCVTRLAPDGIDRRIALKAAVSDLQPTTKAAIAAQPWLGTTPGDDPAVPDGSDPLNLDAAVWFSATSGVYGAGDGTANLPCRSSVLFKNSSMTYPAHAVRYFTDGSTPVYCVGLYPRTGWSANAAGTTVTFSLDGVTDVMYADESSGTWNEKFEDPLAFRHLQTWVKICILAYETDAITSWGSITEVSIQNPHGAVTVSFSDGSLSYSGEGATLTAFEGATPLKVSSQQVGSVLCVPATSYTVTVKTTNVPAGKTVTVDLANLDSSAPTVEYVTGKVYVLSLFFHSLKMIDATCTLVDWDDEYNTLIGS